jgi:hypothetical protein
MPEVDPKMQSVMNLKIKFRESFRPFAPIVLAERAHEVFDMAEEVRTARTCWWSRRCRGHEACRKSMEDGRRLEKLKAPGRRFRPSPTSTTRPGCRPWTVNGTRGFTG